MVTSGERFPSASFLRFWRAGAVSGMGTYVTLFALQVLVITTLDGSESDVGWVNSARFLPFLVFGLIVGALVDGRRRLPIMIVTDLAQAALLLAIPLLWWLGWLSLPSLIVIVLGYGTASVVNAAATMSFLPRLVERQHLLPAHARIDGADAVAATAGPGAGALLVWAVGAPLVFLVDSLTYLYSALTLRRIAFEEPAPRTGVTVRRLLADVGEGARWAYGGSGLRTLAIWTHVWFAGNAILGVVLALYVLRTLHLTTFHLGAIGTAGGLGAVVGASITTWVGRRLGTGRTIIVCRLIEALGVLVLVLAGHGMTKAATIAVLVVGQVLWGLAMGMSNAHETSYRQLVTPDELQARTNTTLRSLNRAVMVIVAPLAGTLAGTWGIRPTLGLAGVIFALTAVGLGASSVRHVRARET